MKFLKNTKGMVFMLVMVISLIMMLVAVSTSSMLIQDAHMIRHLKHSAQAQFLAEGGIADAVAILIDDFSAKDTPTDFPETDLGGGTFDVTVYQIGAVEPKRVLLSSKGKYRGVTRTVAAEVENVSSPMMTNALSAGTNIYLTANNGSISINGNIHANNRMTLHAQNSNISVEYVSEDAPGNATCSSARPHAFKKIENSPQTVTIAGEEGQGFARLGMPVFDFVHFKDTAISSGTYYDPPTGTKTFAGEAISGGTIGLTYVDGNATFKGDCTITGGFVANGNITLNSGNILNVQEHANEKYPVFMSQSGNQSKLFGQFNTAGEYIVYSTNDIQIETPSEVGSALLGTVMAGGTFSITANKALSLTYQSVTSSYVQPEVVEIVSWNR